MRKSAATVVLVVAWSAVAAWAQEPVLRLIDMKGSGGKPLVQHRKAQETRWYPAFVGSEGIVTDHFRTDAKTVAALEFFIGGRVGVAQDTEMEIVTDRSVSSVGPAIQRVVLRNGTLWMKSGSKLSRPLEIQTNGGTMGIKGTEFTLETHPDSATKLAVLEGSVEVRDQANKYLGVANAGDVYSLKDGREPEHQVMRLDDIYRMTQKLLQETGLSVVAQSMDEAPGKVSHSEREDARIGVEVVKADLKISKEGGEVGRKGLDLLNEKLNSLKAKDDAGFYLASPYRDAIRAGVGPSGGSLLSPLTPAPSATETLFTWKDYPGADGYVLFVSDGSDFKNILYSDRVRDTRAVYPAVARPLSPGRYYWRIIPVQSDDSVVLGALAGQAQFDISAPP